MTKRIYAYTLPGKDDVEWKRHAGRPIAGRGVIKVGETTRDVRARLKEQLGTAYPQLNGVSILLDEPAVDVDGEEFSDRDVHRVLVEMGAHRDSEWFEATLEEVRAAIVAVRNKRDVEERRTEDFPMRPEQAVAVEKTADYFSQRTDDKGVLKYLWNAKMRFGKTFTAYQLAKRMGWKRVLVLTYKPAVKTAWQDDLLSHVDFAGWRYVDRDTDPREREDWSNDVTTPLVWFASFQDLGGRTEAGQVKDHNENIHLTDWDCIILDEYHFGAWRDGAREMYDPVDKKLADQEEQDESVGLADLNEVLEVNTRHILYLSGTPFRAITNGEFEEDQIFNWTYLDEQRAKSGWAGDLRENPYLDLPQMQIYSYEMPAAARSYKDDGEFDGFSLSALFRAKRSTLAAGHTSIGRFVFDRPDDVRSFLDLLRGRLDDQMKSLVVAGQKAPFPYEHVGFREAVRHSVWFMPDVASCFAMRDMLMRDPFFSGYEVVVAAGSGAGQGAEAKPPVEAAISKTERDSRYEGTITLSCGKLMTGVTVKEWGAIFMLRPLESPETYFQAAFRVQSPNSWRDDHGDLHVRKDTCYVFEFDPNRALNLVATYGARLASAGEQTPREAIGSLVNYLPIYGFSGGEMVRLDASGILDWATAGIGASALARRWNSPLLVDVSSATLEHLLNDPELLEALEKIDAFRGIGDTAQHVVTSSKLLKKAKRDQGGKLTPEQEGLKKESNRHKKEIREKLQKLLTRIPIFMYVTDYREEALKHVIESLDSDLFERTTNLTVADFKKLNDIGLFRPGHMEEVIWRFRQFETRSLEYAMTDEERDELESRPAQHWDEPA